MYLRLKRTVSIMLMIAVITVMAGTTPAFATSNVKKPYINASGAIVYCENTGEIIYSKNMNSRYDPLSMTKLMTVILAVQHLPLDKEVTISKAAASQGECTMNLVAGEKLTVKDLIYGALLPSANDAAYALGEAVSGDMNSFVALMNRTAENIGCKNTRFKNANGMKVSGHKSSAYDILQIAKVAFSNDIIKKAAGTREYTVSPTNKSKKRTLKTHIDFIKDRNSGVYAAKTGYWDDTNSGMALAYKKNGLNLEIVVISDSLSSRSSDIKKLINYATKKVEGVRVIGAGKDVGNVRIKHGVKTRLSAYTKETGYAYLPREGSKKLISTKTVIDSNVTAPVKSGQIVGKYQIFVADELVNEIDLVIKEDVDTGWFTSYFGISNMMATFIGIGILLLAVVIVILLILKARNNKRKQKIRQRKVMRMAMQELQKEEEHKERDWTF